MYPSPTLMGRITDAMLADPDCCGTGTFQLRLSKAPFVPSTLVGFEEATFDGYAAAACISWVNGIDPLSGDRKLTLLPPVGGIKFSVTGNTSLPMTIYGFKVMNGGANEAIGSALFDPPLILQQAPSTFFVSNGYLQLLPSFII